MKILNVDKYKICEAMFEGVRIILNYLGETYSPAYIQGISGAVFRISGICPCAPTCSAVRWTPDFIRYLGYEIIEYEIQSDPSAKIGRMIEAVRKEIDKGRPALVWHAFTNAEWDVVCGYDEEKRTFLGRGSYQGLDVPASEPWDRASKAVEICPAFGAIAFGNKIFSFDKHSAEIEALREAVRHSREINGPSPDGKWTMYHGISCYRRWADSFARPGKDRDVGDAYCYSIYSSTHRAAADFLREIADRYTTASVFLLNAADIFEKETKLLKSIENLLGWSSPWGVDEERSNRASQVLKQCADTYEKAIESMEDALTFMI